MSDEQQYRPVSATFIGAMNLGLERGSAQGYCGWDRQWQNCEFPREPTGPQGLLMSLLDEGVDKLRFALLVGSSEEVEQRAANVANFAMFVADIHPNNSEHYDHFTKLTAINDLLPVFLKSISKKVTSGELELDDYTVVTKLFELAGLGVINDGSQAE